MFSFLSKYFETDTRFYYLSLLKESNDTFSIHGLWPQYDKNSYPSYCKKDNFSIDKLQPIIKELNYCWYSNEEKNSKFWEHEYYKHGSCMFTDMTELEYFQKTIELYREAIRLDLPDKYYSNNKCLIPVSLEFKFSS